MENIQHMENIQPTKKFNKKKIIYPIKSIQLQKIILKVSESQLLLIFLVAILSLEIFTFPEKKILHVFYVI